MCCISLGSFEDEHLHLRVSFHKIGLFAPCWSAPGPEVQRIMHLQIAASKVPNAFTYYNNEKAAFTYSKYAEESLGIPIGYELYCLHPRFRGRTLSAQTRFHGDVCVDKVLSHLHYLKNRLKKLDQKSRVPLKWQLNLKLRKSLKDTIINMKIPMCRMHYCIGRLNTPT